MAASNNLSDWLQKKTIWGDGKKVLPIIEQIKSFGEDIISINYQ